MDMQDGAHLHIKVGDRVIADRVIYCSSSASRREGLLSFRKLEPGEGILMAMPTARQGKKGVVTSIHMMGMKFPICAAWLDQEGRVVHATIAKPWGLYYASPEPAWYVLEAHPDLVDKLEKGIKIHWEEVF
jgi:uncharacterized membrane protein (UPF0127 family)